MRQRIAYLGDSAQPGPASYLCGIMTHFEMAYVYVPSDVAPPPEIFADDIGLYILSDYPANQLSATDMTRLTERVEAGAGLLMLGGWESYHGLGGDWDGTPIGDLLPVEIATTDDRRNWPQLILMRQATEHPIVTDLPFTHPAGIGGYNEFTARAGATVILEGERFCIACEDDSAPKFDAVGRFPLLVVSNGEAGRRACLATDVAPHWVGGFVDWGDTRLTVKMGEDFVEVGNHYAQFFRNLLAWCMSREK